jgi:hypothetical protein
MDPGVAGANTSTPSTSGSGETQSMMPQNALGPGVAGPSTAGSSQWSASEQSTFALCQQSRPGGPCPRGTSRTHPIPPPPAHGIVERELVARDIGLPNLTTRGVVRVMYDHFSSSSRVNMINIGNIDPVLVVKIIYKNLEVVDYKELKKLATNDNCPFGNIRAVFCSTGRNGEFTFFFIYDPFTQDEPRRVMRLFFSLAQALFLSVNGVPNLMLCAVADYAGPLSHQDEALAFVSDNKALAQRWLRVRHFPPGDLEDTSYDFCSFLRFLEPLYGFSSRHLSPDYGQ